MYINQFKEQENIDELYAFLVTCALSSTLTVKIILVN